MAMPVQKTVQNILAKAILLYFASPLGKGKVYGLHIEP